MGNVGPSWDNTTLIMSCCGLTVLCGLRKRSRAERERVKAEVARAAHSQAADREELFKKISAIVD